MAHRVLQVLVIISTLSRRYILCYDKNKYLNDALMKTSTRISPLITADLRRHYASKNSDVSPPPPPPPPSPPPSPLHIEEAPPLALGQAPPAVLWQVPLVVYARAVYEPVEHDHPPLTAIRALIAADRRRQRRRRPGGSGSSGGSSSLDDSDSVYDY